MEEEEKRGRGGRKSLRAKSGDDGRGVFPIILFGRPARAFGDKKHKNDEKAGHLMVSLYSETERGESYMAGSDWKAKGKT